MSRTLGAAATGTLLAAVALSVLALAQVQPVALTISSALTELTLEPGSSDTVLLTLENQGAFDGVATLVIAGADAGWVAALADDEISIPAGSTASVELALTAPATRDGAASEAPITVSGTLTDVTGAFQSSAATSLTGRLTAPPIPPEPFPWLWVIGGIVVVLAAGTVAASWYAVRRREGGIEVSVPGTRTEARAGYDAFVPVEVRNVSSRARIVRVHAEGAPSGWVVGTNLATIPLEAKGSISVWLAVRPPSEASLGSEVDLLVVARPTEARWSRGGKPVPIRVVGDVVPTRLGMELQPPTLVRLGRTDDGLHQ